MFELYLMDLTPEKRLEFLEAHGAWEVDVEDPSTFPNNWDIVPIMVFDIDDVDDTDDLVSRPTAERPHQEAGICPVCGSTDLRYDSSSIDSLQECYPWTCNTCKSSGEEWYGLHFIEHTNVEKI